jgi:polyphosphate:AMP phosphotransferase
VTEQDWKHFDLYDRFRKISERALRRTSTAEAPWIVVEGGDKNYRSLTVGKVLLDALRRRLDAIPAAPPEARPAAASAAPSAGLAIDGRSILRNLDLGKKLDRAEYDERLEAAQRRLNLLSRDAKFLRKRSVVAVFEGWDAAGKGGTIRRVTHALDARRYTLVPIAAPTDEERAQPYLWRFWRHVQGRGRFTLFDRSWYGRVLVERVEGFCREDDWKRAYQEINDFEEQLARHGAVVAKFWLHVSKEEQLARFEEREATGFKHYKITPEDWRNRDKWDAYEVAVGDAFDRTSTVLAPWTLVEANDKLHARVKVLETLCARIEDSL